MKLVAFLVLSIAAIAVGQDITCDWEDCDVPCGQGQRKCTRSNGKIWMHQCHVQDCEAIDGCGKADIVFIFDSSSSIGDKNYWILKQFAVDVMKGLTIGADESRIGLVIYADHAETKFGFSAYLEEESLENALWNTPWLMGVTNTQDALIHAKTMIDESARAEVKHIVIIITDGESNIKADNTIPAADDLHNSGVEIFTIGIGAVNEDECRGIASDDGPEATEDFHFHYVPSYSALVAITNTIISDTCIAANRSECDPWGQYGECVPTDGQCGAGLRTRSRECRFYLFQGAEAEKRMSYDNIPCNIPCAPVCEDDCAQNSCNIDPSIDNCETFNKCVRMCECMMTAP
jgi:uncharacterized protein YegL